MKSFIAATTLFASLAIAQVPSDWPSSGWAQNMTVTSQGWAPATIATGPASFVTESVTTYGAPFSNNASTWTVPQTVTYETGWSSSQGFTVMKCGPLAPCNTTTTATSSSVAWSSASLVAGSTSAMITSSWAATSTAAQQATSASSVAIATHTGAAAQNVVGFGAAALAGLAMVL